jgi:hypothetical protein
MAIPELEELMALLADPNDRAAFEQILGRNSALADRTKASNNLYSAYVDGDQAALAAEEAKLRRTPAVVRNGPQVVSQAQTFDAATIDQMLQSKLDAIFGAEDFTKRVSGIVKKTAEEIGPVWKAESTRSMDEIYTIRRNHEREFGKELDTKVLSTFIDEQKTKGKSYSSYVDAYNDFANEDRVQHRITKGIADGLAAQATNNVPGASLSRVNPLAPKFMREGPVDTSRGAGLDSAAKAFRQLQNSHVN